LGAVRSVRLGGGIAYIADGGRSVAIHGDGVDVVVTGSVEPSVLRTFAASLGIRGVRVPDGWDEAAVVGLDDAAATAVVQTLPVRAGFAPPAVRVDDGTVTLTFAGAGERLVVLSTRVDDALRPPIDPDAVGVMVRGRTGRWSPASGDLEWVERGQAWSMRSATVSLGELLALADALEAP
jgi:hypothetical protein